MVFALCEHIGLFHNQIFHVICVWLLKDLLSPSFPETPDKWEIRVPWTMVGDGRAVVHRVCLQTWSGQYCGGGQGRLGRGKITWHGT